MNWAKNIAVAVAFLCSVAVAGSIELNRTTTNPALPVTGTNGTFTGTLSVAGAFTTDTGITVSSSAGTGAGLNLASVDPFVYASGSNSTLNISSNISAANASNTPQTAHVAIYPQNALDSADYVFSVSTSTFSNLLSLTQGGTATITGNTLMTGDVSVGSGGSGDLLLFRDVYMQNGTRRTDTETAPTVVACSGTAASITASNGSAAFQVDVGTSCAGENTISITLPAATTGWVCQCSSTTADRILQQKAASSTTVAVLTNIVISTGAAGDFTDGADLFCGCRGY